MKRPLAIVRLLIPSVVLLAACGDDSTGPRTFAVPGNQNNGRIDIVNDASALEARVTYSAESEIDVHHDGPNEEALRAPKKRNFTLTLLAEVLPPTVDGRTLQATSVAIRGNRAIVGYGMAGPDYLGGVDVFNLIDGQRPRLESQATLLDSDVFDVSTYGTQVYLAGSTNEPTFEFPSTCEVLALEGHKLNLVENNRLDIRSFVATSTKGALARVFSTSGNTGGLTAMDPITWTETDFVELDDARWVDVAGGRVVVAQGTPGRLAVFEELTLAPLGVYPFEGADVPESKTTVEVVGGKAFIGAGPGGVQILSVETGAVLGSVPIPDPQALGLDPAVVVTNSVSVDGDLLFISNGEAGVYVAQGEQDFALSGSEEPQNIELLGRLEVGALQSVNHIAFKNEHLIVAAGLGGLKIIKVDR